MPDDNRASETFFELTVRPARIEDVARIVEFNRKLAAETEQLRLDPATLQAGVEAVLLDPAKGRYFVAVAGEQVVGQIMHTREWSDWRNGDIWWIQSVYVDSTARRTGVFRALFKSLREAARTTPGVVGVRLYVEHSNEPALAVYQRLGMKRAGYDVMEDVWTNVPQQL